MTIVTDKILVNTKGFTDIIDITNQVQTCIQKHNVKEGLVHVYVIGSTASVTTIEYEPGLRQDFPNMLSRIVPENIEYQHENMWHDGNGHSHVKASLIGPSLTIPFNDGTLMLGIWQQIVILEMDINKRERNVILQIIGE